MKLFQNIKKWASSGDEDDIADVDKPLDSPYTKYLQDRHDDTNGKILKPTSRDVFLLTPEVRHGADTVGLFNAARNLVLIRDPHAGNTGRILRWKIPAGSTLFWGNWRGYGTDTPGLYNPQRAGFFLWHGLEQQQAHISLFYGLPNRGWIPLVGDWDGDGKDGIGLYDPDSGYFFLRNSLTSGLPDHYFRLDSAPGNGIPMAGDWDGDGISGVGLYDPQSGSFSLTNHLAPGGPEQVFTVMNPDPQAIPLSGDWDGSGADKVGLYLHQPSRFMLWPKLTQADNPLSFRFTHKGMRGLPFSLRWTD